MAYCPHCGNEVGEWERFCSSCGAPLDQQRTQMDYTASQTDHFMPSQPGQSYSGYDQRGYQQPPPRGYGYQQPPMYPVGVSEKRPEITLILGLVIGLLGLWGIGQIFVGRIMRGILFLILGLVFGPALVFFVFLGVSFTFGFAVVLGVFIPIIWFILWIYQAYDAYKLAQEYNMNLRRTGTPPW